MKAIRNYLWILVATLMVTSMMTLLSCSKDDDGGQQPTPTPQQLTVAVVAPLSDAAMKGRLERIAQRLLDSTSVITLKLEWHDEQTEDMDALGNQLSVRDDVAAIVGPFDNERMARFAPYCQKTHKPLIAPTTTSEEILRRYAVSSAGDPGMVNKEAFFWPLCQSDVTLTETMLSHYVTQIGSYAQMGRLNCAFFSPSDKYGQTFYDWSPFFTLSMNVDLQGNERYDTTEDMLRKMTQYLNNIELNVNGLLSNNFCVVETVQQMYEVARMRRDLVIRLNGGDVNDPFWNDYWQGLEILFRTWFAFSALSEEGIASLGDNVAKTLQGYQGFSPYADPSTGFEKDYEERYGVKPTFAECKLYDALLLVTLAAQHEKNNNGQFTTDSKHSLNQSIYAIAAADGASIRGVSGVISFDPTSCTQLTPNTYVHWQIADGHILHPTYYGPDGKKVVGPTVSLDIFYDEETAMKDFADMATDSDLGIDYPPLSDQYAVLVQGSSGMAGYRHQSDVLSVYQLLRRGGFDDDHIILIIDAALARDPENNEPGVVRGGLDMADLLSGKDAAKGYPAAVVDYDAATLTAADISDILTGKSSNKLPVVLPTPSSTKGPMPDNNASASLPNVLFYWSGHGRNTAHGGANELVWRETEAGQGMTADLLRKTVEQMSLRKMFVILEPCYSGDVALALKGQQGVLAMTGASGDEQSWAEFWNPNLGRYGTWMCDRFTLNVVQCLKEKPSTTYLDLYLYCMCNTIGSHVKLINADKFGNLYRNTPQEFFEKVTVNN